MNPGDRPRRGLTKVLAVLSTAGLVAGLAVLADGDPAAAGELERFASCDAIAAWGASDAPEAGVAVPDDALAVTDDVATAGSGDRNAAGPGGTTGGDPGAPAAPQAALPAEQSPATTAASFDDTGADAERSAEAGASDEPASAAADVDDGTNLIVEGVDELDVIDLLDRDHALVSAASRLSVIDLVDDRIVASLEISPAAQITYDRANELAWVVGTDDEGRLTVTRVGVTATSLTAGDRWSTGGWLVDARRIGDRLYLVASDGYDGGIDPAAIPFADGPVACDQVLHPIGDSDPSATLLVELPATGALEPVHATEVVGSGSAIHVTTEAAYLATPLYGETTQTSFHRFDLDTLEHTGSGRIDGMLLNEFAMSDHDGFLRVAVTLGGGMRGMAIDAMPTDVAVDEVAPTTMPASSGAPLNEIVVLDTDGALDVVGRTPRFGHPGETLQGIRFVGATAYAVTFLQTDPFYVIALDDPTAPRVAGEVELPGFSSYLHPIGAGLVAGFGPDATGKIGVKLFDVSDPSRPTVVDELALGDESPVAWDHHAFVDLGEGRFAVPSTTYRESRPVDCTPERQRQLEAQERRLTEETDALMAPVEYDQSRLDTAAQARLQQLELQRQGIYDAGCLYPTPQSESSVLVVDTTGGRLQLVERLGVVRAGTSAERVLPTDDGWALLAGNHWIVVDDGGSEVADLELGPTDVAYPVDIGFPAPRPIEG